MMMKKVYVSVIAQFNLDDTVVPLSVLWHDGRTLTVDKVLDVRHDVHSPSGGIADRYTVRIRNKETFVYYAHPKWFVEIPNQ